MLKFYSLLDQVASQYGLPFLARNDEDAMRLIRDAMQDEQSFLARHYETFVLYRLGDFDPVHGTIVAHRERVFDLASMEMDNA